MNYSPDPCGPCIATKSGGTDAAPSKAVRWFVNWLHMCLANIAARCDWFDMVVVICDNTCLFR